MAFYARSFSAEIIVPSENERREIQIDQMNLKSFNKFHVNDRKQVKINISFFSITIRVPERVRGQFESIKIAVKRSLNAFYVKMILLVSNLFRLLDLKQQRKKKEN